MVSLGPIITMPSLNRCSEMMIKRSPRKRYRLPVIGFAPDDFPIYGHWFTDQNGQLVKAEAGYETFPGDSRTPLPTARHVTPPTLWDIANKPQDFASDFGLEMSRYEQDWFYAGTGSLDECNGALDIHANYAIA
jgi:hypothetical protein